MSDAQTIWQLSLALGCSVGAYWMKVQSGVSDDGKASDICNGMADGGLLRGVSDRRLDRGAYPMKGKNEARGGAEIIDLLDHRNRRALIAHGYVVRRRAVSDEVTP